MKQQFAALALAGLTLAGCSQENAPTGQSKGADASGVTSMMDAEQYIEELNARVESETVLNTRNPGKIEVDKTIRIDVPNIFTEYSTLGALPACDGNKVVETSVVTPLDQSYCNAIAPLEAERKTRLSAAEDNYSQTYKEDSNRAYQTLKVAKNETMDTFRNALLPIQTDFLRANTGIDGRTIIQVALNGTPATTVLAHKDVDRIVSLPKSASDLLVTLPGLYPHCPAENASRINPTTPDQIYCDAISDLETTKQEEKQTAEEDYKKAREQAQATYDEAIKAIDPTLPYYDRLTAKNEARSARDTIFVEASSNKTVASAKTGIAYDKGLNEICLEYLRASSGKDGKFVIEFVPETPRKYETPTTSLE